MNKLALSIVALSLLFFRIEIKAQSLINSSGNSEKFRLVTEHLLPNVVAKDAPPMSIHERMEHYKVRGVSIAIIQNYKIVASGAFGYADEGLKKQMSWQTLLQAGSVSKSLNAMGVLKLVQQGKINLNTDINQYLTSWKFPYDEKSKGKKITVANLLSHTGGLNLHGFPGYEKGKPIPDIVQVLKGEEPANTPPVRSMFEPGLRSEYSGGGVTISQLIVMDVTHQPYDNYMNPILRSMGMSTSSYSQPPVEKKADSVLRYQGRNSYKMLPVNEKGQLAAGYNLQGEEIKGKYHIYPEQAAAGLWANPTELSQFIIEIQRSLKGQSNKVLDQKTTQLMLTPYIDGTAALGVFVDDMDGTKYFQHGGADEGFRTQYYGSLEGGNGVVVMVNSDNGAIIDEIINSVANVYLFKGLNKSKQTITVSPLVLQQYAGKYQTAPDVVLNVLFADGHLYVQMGQGNKAELFAETPGKFVLKEAAVEIEFVKDDAGKVVKAMINEGGIHEAKKIE